MESDEIENKQYTKATNKHIHKGKEMKKDVTRRQKKVWEAKKTGIEICFP